MRNSLSLVVASAGIVIASQNVFSVHDDILAFPQYEVVFSDTYISEYDAEALLSKPASSAVSTPDSRDVDHNKAQRPLGNDGTPILGDGKEIHETLWLHDQEYLCTIPIVELPPRNETSEAEAKAEEQKELARATDRGWELLQDLDGSCLYFMSGWWSYSFCYNKEVTQFHQLPAPPGKGHFPPQRDPSTAQYVLGRAHTETKEEDEYGNDVEVHKGQASTSPPHTEIQIKGDTRYLIQRLDGGTVCDLTGKPRKMEIQYHCSPQASDRIGWIKEVTTCSYVMMVYTPRLCGDVAFLPPKEVRANTIACRMVVPEDEVSYWSSLKTIEAERIMKQAKEEDPVINIGGVILGAKKFAGKDGQRLPLPAGWQNGQSQEPAIDVIAKSKSKAEGGKVDVLSPEDLHKLDLDPEIVEQLRKELEEIAGEKGWKLEVVEIPGDVREIRGIVDGDEDEENTEYVAKTGESNSDEGSEETYKEEL